MPGSRPHRAEIHFHPACRDTGTLQRLAAQLSQDEMMAHYSRQFAALSALCHRLGDKVTVMEGLLDQMTVEQAGDLRQRVDSLRSCAGRMVAIAQALEEVPRHVPPIVDTQPPAR